MPRILFALLVTQLIALGAAAQSEYGRATGGTIDVLTKAARRTSGSLMLTRSTGGQGYEAALGGELLDDRVWYFAAASMLPRTQFATSPVTAIDAKGTAQPVDWSTVVASYSHFREPMLGAPPASFLSLHSTSLLSDRMMLDLSFSSSSTSRP